MNARLWRIGGLILGAGIFVRFYHLDFGLPDLLAVDGFKFVGEASRMVSTGDWSPQLFQYPGLLTNLLALLYRIFGIQGTYAQYLTAHIISALAGTALILATGYAASAVCGRFGQLLAMGLEAVCIVSVTQSRMPAPDILMALFMTAAMAVMVSETATTKSFALAGALGGLALGAKFTGIFIFPFIIVAALSHRVPGRTSRTVVVQRCAAGLLAGVLVFLCTTPWFVPRAPAYIRDMLQEFQIQRAGQIGRVQGSYLDYLFSPTANWNQPWLGTSLRANLGLPVLVTGIAALLAALLGRGGRTVAFYAAYVVIFLATISSPGRLKAISFLMPVLSLFYVVVAWFVEAVLARVLKGRVARVRTLAGTLAAGILLAVPILKTARFVGMTRRPLTNALAYAWARTHIEPRAITMISPFFIDNLTQLPIRPVFLQQVGARQYGFPENVGPSPERDPIYTPQIIDEMRGFGGRYLILNSYFEDAFSPVPENQRFFPRSVLSYQAFRERLAAEAELVYEIKGFSEGRFGPDISIYRLTETPTGGH